MDTADFITCKETRRKAEKKIELDRNDLEPETFVTEDERLDRSLHADGLFVHRYMKA